MRELLPCDNVPVTIFNEYRITCIEVLQTKKEQLLEQLAEI